ncbi:unnamed protein product [Malus baccata var. baccata]
MVYSPLSLQVLLSSVTAGSKGPTKKQLLSFLKSKSSDELNSLVSHLVPRVLSDGSTRGGPCVNSANSLWVEHSLTVKPSFKRMLVNVYNAVIKEVSFGTDPDKARVQVNSWTKKETKGLIPEALPPGSVGENTMLLLLNTIYFKGVWSDRFDPSETEECKFGLLDGSTVEAPFMIESYGWHYVKAFDGFKVSKLPYKQGKDKERRFSMYFLLPNSRNGLPALVKRVCSEPDFLDCHLPEIQREPGALKIPKFNINSNFLASEILVKLGLVLTFNGNGDFSEMVESGIGDPKIIHKSFIEVDEGGTKAAAVSTFDGGADCAGPFEPIKSINFVADHPFMFLIREEMTGTVLFIGHVLNPLEE